MRLSITVLALTCASLLAGCATTSPVPRAENFPLTSQSKVRSAGHWNLLSKDVIEQTLMTLSKVDSTSALYVALPPNATTFDISFREFLITELVKRGRVVQTSPDRAIEVSYQAHVVRHNSPRPNLAAGQLTLITAGLWAIHGLSPMHADAMFAGALGLAAAADHFSSANAGGPTHTELVLSTTVVAGGRYLTRKTDVYYIEETDTPLFAALSAVRPMSFRVVDQ